MLKRNVSTADLVVLLNHLGVDETKSSIDSKISRGTFSASFLIQCLIAIGCRKIEIEEFEPFMSIAAEPNPNYNLSEHGK
ncbi:MAG: hypothetical protein COW03_00075 [Cytophagales bacterium CG12_big_fil_rev_8_21_14_0_65_40_12]|nr:MAG: hypothetical protein COW03_00075 [Cytophagales bacterium CG12_big_fil_rev_8_21_14_0_65_40_12]